MNLSTLKSIAEETVAAGRRSVGYGSRHGEEVASIDGDINAVLDRLTVIVDKQRAATDARREIAAAVVPKIEPARAAAEKVARAKAAGFNIEGTRGKAAAAAAATMDELKTAYAVGVAQYQVSLTESDALETEAEALLALLANLKAESAAARKPVHRRWGGRN